MTFEKNTRLIFSAIPALWVLLGMGMLFRTASASINGVNIQPGLLRENAAGNPACPVSMLAYWELEETGEPYLDSFDEHDAANTGTAPVQVVGKFGNAQDFGLTTTGIDAPSHADFDWGANESFSIEFWVKPDIDGCQAHSRVAVGRDDGTGVQWWVGCAAVSGQATFQLDDSNTIRKSVKGVSITDGAWHHIVAVRDGATDTNYIYVDNVQNAVAANTYTGDFTADAPANVNIGWINHRIDSPTIHRFLGVIDEVAIYDKALTPNDVSLHFKGGQGGTPRAYCDIPTDVYIPLILK
jgi:hypothetical protein